MIWVCWRSALAGDYDGASEDEFEAQDLQIKTIDISPAMTTRAYAAKWQLSGHDIEVIAATFRDVGLKPYVVILNLTLQFYLQMRSVLERFMRH
jgi:hypothetical protein